MKHLEFVISAPLQSYGKPNAAAIRRTAMKPTKSAIIGMIGAAFGIERGDERLSELYNQLKFETQTVKQGSLLIDYQNVHYNTKPSNFTGGNKNKQVWKHYLQDAKFRITLSGDDKLIQDVAYALKHPKFALYLGRRSCPLDRPLDLDIY